MPPIYAYSKPAPVPAALAGGDYLVSLSVQRVDAEALTPAELRKIKAALAAALAPSKPARKASSKTKLAEPAPKAKAARTARSR